MVSVRCKIELADASHAKFTISTPVRWWLEKWFLIHAQFHFLCIMLFFPIVSSIVSPSSLFAPTTRLMLKNAGKLSKFPFLDILITNLWLDDPYCLSFAIAPYAGNRFDSSLFPHPPVACKYFNYPSLFFCLTLDSDLLVLMCIKETK